MNSQEYIEVAIKITPFSEENAEILTAEISELPFESFTAEHRRNDMLTLFSDIEVLANSELFIGTLSSNIGMYMYWRMPEGKCFGVDYNDWKIW